MRFPLLLFVLTAKLIYSRYFVFCFVALLLPAAGALVYLMSLVRRATRRGAAVTAARLMTSRPGCPLGMTAS